MKHVSRFAFVLAALWAACSSPRQGSETTGNVAGGPEDAARPPERGPVEGGGGQAGAIEAGLPASEPDLHMFANGCFALKDAQERVLKQTAKGDGYELVAGEIKDAARFFMKASDLATYLFYDPEGGYLVAEDGPLLRQTTLQSDILKVDDSYVSGAEWELQVSGKTAAGIAQYQLRHRKSGKFLVHSGLIASPSEAAALTFEPVQGCAEHPELSVDASGVVQRRTFDDGDVYGIVDTHSHILSNFGFGGGGVFHGAPFHRLGVEHALSDCEQFHGKMGRRDFFGFGFSGGAGSPNLTSLLPALITGQLGEDNHHTAGYPDFTDWPAAPVSSTHQTQYYRWLERAYLSGLRLVIQHATTNEIICDFMVGQGYQPVRYSCEDMVAVDRIIDETRAMERYIDAQAGGPGRGFFRVVETPERAREVIKDGKMAVVLGIETSNLFDCLSVPRKGGPTCNEAYVKAQLDAYHARGVRALFPVHKYDNAFSAGDGNRGFIELGNFLNSGHWSNFVLDCPADVPTVFDHGNVNFGGINEPRAQYMSKPPNNMSGFAARPILTVTPYLLRLQKGPLKGDYCQNAGLTDLGETLLREMMTRGMIIEIDHLPRRSYQRAFEMLEEYDYPAAATHGTNGFEGRLYALGGVSKSGLGRCRDPQRKGAMLRALQQRVALIKKHGGYPAEGFGLDLNGFAGAPGPRFGEQSDCKAAQQEPVTYPFQSYAGDVTFSQPQVGNRKIDFNTEGLAHIGLMPELIEDARRDAASEADLEPLFRSAEGYLRMWERAEARAKALREQAP